MMSLKLDFLCYKYLLTEVKQKIQKRSNVDYTIKQLHQLNLK